MKVTFEVDVDLELDKLGYLKEFISSRIFLLQKYFGFKDVSLVYMKSSSKRGYHFFFTVSTKKHLTKEQINMIQFLLGDDHVRTYINLIRIKCGAKYWRKMFDYVIGKRKDPKCERCRIRKVFHERLEKCLKRKKEKSQ